MRTAVHLSSLRTMFYSLSAALSAKALVIAAVTASTCSIICGAACDMGQPGECRGLGGMFGPCDDHLASLCLGGMECLVTESGRMCLPNPGSPNFDHELADACQNSVGGEMSCERTRCFADCADAPCVGGAVCDPSTKMCVHPDEPVDPTPPPECGEEGQLFGPCPPDTHLCAPGLICLDSLPDGTICGVDLETGPTGIEVVACAAQFGVKAPTCDFFNEDCYSPCEDEPDCLGGTVCSHDWHACVWPEVAP